MSNLKEGSVLLVGDLMLDEYLYGTIDRISPEAPVGILSWTKLTASLGGARIMGRNLAALHWEIFLAGGVGRDHAGEALFHLAIHGGMPTAGLVYADGPTPL